MGNYGCRENKALFVRRTWIRCNPTLVKKLEFFEPPSTVRHDSICGLGFTSCNLFDNCITQQKSEHFPAHLPLERKVRCLLALVSGILVDFTKNVIYKYS